MSVVVNFAVPVVAEAQHLQLAAEGADVFFGGRSRGGAGVNGVLLGGQAEGVPAHRVQHVLPAHALIAADDVRGGVPFGMADVQAIAAGVGEHVQHVDLPPRGRARRGKGPLGLPVLLPLGLDRGRVVSGHSGVVCRAIAAGKCREKAHRDSGRGGGGLILMRCPTSGKPRRPFRFAQHRGGLIAHAVTARSSARSAKRTALERRRRIGYKFGPFYPVCIDHYPVGSSPRS